MSGCSASRHGTRAAYVRGCRCPEARAANSRYQAYRERRLARAAFNADEPFTVPVEQTRSVVLQLRGIGWSLRRIEAETGIGRDHLQRIQGHTNRPVQTVRIATHKRLAALLERDVAVADGHRVDAQPTWRLIHGLIALGYPKCWIAGQITGGRALQLSPWLVTVANARKVRALADRYGMTPGPSDAARRYATERGWTTELLWDDPPFLGSTDVPEAPDVDEVAVARFLNGDNGIRLNRDEKWAAYLTLRAQRVTHNQATIRLGLSGATGKVWAARYDDETVPAGRTA